LPSGALIVAVFEFVLLLFSLCVHECAHAWMASRLGDQTAREMGRVSLNPMDHIDPIGTLLFPALMIFGPLVGFTFFGGMLIGWAKPTPIITRNFRRIVRDDNLTTLAGPVSNLLIVFAAMIVLAIVSVAVPDGRQYVYYAFHRNLLVGVVLGCADRSAARDAGDLGKPLALLLQSAPHSSAGRQPSTEERAALQRRPGL